MEIIFLILIILLLWLLVRPFFLVGRQVHRQYRAARDFQERMRSQFGGFGTEPSAAAGQRRKAGWHASGRQRKKRILPHEGEYIPFTEIVVEITITHDDAFFPAPEPRIIDITWIDL